MFCPSMKNHDKNIRQLKCCKENKDFCTGCILIILKYHIKHGNFMDSALNSEIKGNDTATRKNIKHMGENKVTFPPFIFPN